MIVGEACLGDIASSRIPPQSSRYFRSGSHEYALEQVDAQALAFRHVARGLAPASRSWIWRVPEAQGVVPQVSTPSQKGEVLAQGPRVDNVGGGVQCLHDVRKIHFDFGHLLRFLV